MKVSKLFSVFVMVFVLTLMALLTGNVRVFAEHEDSALELETQEFRKNFNMDLNYDKSIAIKSEEFGVYLTSEEEKMLQDRFKKQDNDIKKVNEYLKENFSMDKIGGVFIDQEAGGIINISLKNNNSINSQEISSLQHIVDASIKFNNVLYSEEQLDNVHNNIAQELESLKKDHNITVYTVMTNLPDNKIDVYIEDLTDEKKDFLINRFGKSLDIKQGKKPIDDSRFTSYNPLQGG
jgi:thioredoxin-related protein